MTKLEMIANSIVSNIERGALREGDQLPSEEKLAERHGVSVGTVQKALARLAQSGIISRQHGRGTFVSGSRMAPADLRYVRFQDLQGHELTSYVHMRSVRKTKQKGAWSDFLGGNAFVRVERTVSFGARLELYSEFWLREEEFVRLDGIPHRSFERSMRSLLDKQLSLPTLRVDQWIRFTFACNCGSRTWARSRAAGVCDGTVWLHATRSTAILPISLFRAVFRTARCRALTPALS